jgi:hypothetical protein
MAQPVEAYLTAPYVGRTLCFSVWVKAGANLTNLQLHVHSTAIGVDQWTANLGSSPGSIFHTETLNPVVGVWQRVYTTFTVPALGVNGLAFRTTFNCTAAGTHLIAGAMVTEGSAPPTYFYRNMPNPQAEFAACQRYYEKSYIRGTVPGTGDTNGIGNFRAQSATNAMSDIQFKVSKRIQNATMSFWSRNGTIDTLTSDTTNADVAVTFGAAQTSGSEDGMKSVVIAGGVAGTWYRGHWAASAEL